MRSVKPEGAYYVGADLMLGLGVDQLLKYPLRLPFDATTNIDGRIYYINLHGVDTLHDPRIHFLQGDVRDLSPTLPGSLLLTLPRPLLVIEDTAHLYETTLAALRFFDPYLMPGEYFLVEDGIVNVSIHGLMRPSDIQSDATAEYGRDDRWAAGS